MDTTILQSHYGCDLDWRAYWEQFKLEHGGDPVTRNGLVLFRDGWRYSLNGYRGPEHPPPADLDERRSLMTTYWRLFVALVRSQATAIREQVANLEKLQRSCSAPLQWTVTYADRATGEQFDESGAVDLAPLRPWLAWFEDKVLEGESMLKDLSQLFWDFRLSSGSVKQGTGFLRHGKSVR